MDQLEARESLELVRQAMGQTRRAIARSGTGYFFIIWGVVWFLGFLGSQLLANAGPWWLALDAVGVVATVLVSLRLARRVRSGYGWRVAMLWLSLVAYSVLLVWVAQPTSQERILVFTTVLLSFGYVALGLWMSPPLVFVGLGITGLALLGWLLAPAYLGYWMAFLGGGGLICVGAYVLVGWK